MSAELRGQRLRCEICGFGRDASAEELDAASQGRGERLALRALAAAPPRSQAAQPAPAFVVPPMPIFKRGAALPVPAKPRGYQPPKER